MKDMCIHNTKGEVVLCSEEESNLKANLEIAKGNILSIMTTTLKVGSDSEYQPIIADRSYKGLEEYVNVNFSSFEYMNYGPPKKRVKLSDDYTLLTQQYIELMQSKYKVTLTSIYNVKFDKAGDIFRLCIALTNYHLKVREEVSLPQKESEHSNTSQS